MTSEQICAPDRSTDNDAHLGKVTRRIGEGTFTGNKGLRIEEPLIFEIGKLNVTGVDIERPAGALHLGGLERKQAPGWPGLREPQVMRHYLRLSQKNYSIDTGIFPLGSCTMKHNPRQNEKVARLSGLSNIHPLQPRETVTGALRLIGELATWVCSLTGMSAIAMSPRAGAHGELCGMMAITAALHARGEVRNKVLVPESAHGTNPATAALLNYDVVAIPSRDDETIDLAAVKHFLNDDVAAIMLTNPNTCGVFERDIAIIADAIHEVGGYFYCDGANFNAIAGKVRPGDLGVDAMHLNLHKTFSTPHGGGGPGSGPVVLSSALADFAPLPFWRLESGEMSLVERRDEVIGDEQPLGRLTSFNGQFGIFVRSLGYLLAHGKDGLRQASEDAVLNANYLSACLKDVMTLAAPDGLSLHEVLFCDEFLRGSGVSTLDFAKALIDEGYHPMTVYFPLVVHGAMLIEPTESESKASLDLFIATLRDLAMAVKRGETERFKQAPRFSPRTRLDEVKAARQRKLRYIPPTPQTISY